ncbi:MAG: D-glycero-beta-D-manno-heptose 1,7-bisphosphate 7-phosphatase [Gammaproteobacteria bacterium]|nr:D-glycero-beta-D-manno-heptose 1,7-bisphosphate 7-phosphatase [Gammaproteobacteria bacterium]
MNDNRPQVIVLDRDGVINQDSPEFVKTTDEWLPLPGSLDAIAALSRAGFLVTVATNQSGVGRGLLTAEMLEEIHKKMVDSIRAAGGKLDGIFVCPHRPDDGCDCRKPNPGMLHQIARRFCSDPAGLRVIGDSIRDLEAAQAVGARPILVRTGNGRKTEKLLPDDSHVRVFDSLADVARALIKDLPL